MGKTSMITGVAALCGCAAAAGGVPGDLAGYVDPFVGTAGTGHTTPAACVPFGLVQAGPDTGNGDWAHCSGYVFGDTNLCGFSQTHLNGTGCADLGDIRLLPFAGDEVPDALPLDKPTERAAPGYYAVTAGGVRTEVTATERVASYRFAFPKAARRRLLVDTQWGLRSWGEATNRVLGAEVAVADGVIAGTLHVKQWNERRLSFVVRPSPAGPAVRSVAELPRAPGEKAPRYVVEFAEGDADVFVNVALSANSATDARANLASDLAFAGQAADQDSFGRVVRRAREKWNAALGVATIDGTDEQKTNWYTALYHLCVQPNNLSDANAASSPRREPAYSTFSCWDTFRAAGPLYTILYPERAEAFVDSLLKQGNRTGHLPIWTLWGADNQCMIGTHSVPMIVDWFLKGGGRETDWEDAYRQVRETLTRRHEGRRKEAWDVYDRYGYYPFDLVRGESVSRTMECAYDDWCAGAMAAKLGHGEDAEFFFRRSASWTNVFDRSIGLVRGRDSRGNWRTPYDPYALGQGGNTDNDFTEGNAFQYSWHVMQDVPGLVAAMGGRERFAERLDALFSAPSRTEGMGEVADVTGLIGQYVHGNEPSHHVVYLYALAGRPDRAAERIREIFDRFYLPKPDGLCGNDDCGQMSAWHVFGALGFYPLNPCGGEYVLGAPQVPRAEVTVGGVGERRKLAVIARGLSKEAKYVRSVCLRSPGSPARLLGATVSHAELMKGGEIVFEMTDRPVRRQSPAEQGAAQE